MHEKRRKLFPEKWEEYYTKLTLVREIYIETKGNYGEEKEYALNVHRKVERFTEQKDSIVHFVQRA